MDADLFLLILYMTLLGASIGTFTGLIPGIHVNTLAAAMLSSYTLLEEALSPMVPYGHLAVCVSSCIVSASIVHSFVDFVPSVFIGAPDPDDTVSMLPGHRLLSEGRGMVAIRSAAIGSCVGACISILMAIPLQYILLAGASDYLDGITPLILTIVVLVMIVRERGVGRMAWAIALLSISGMLGMACMDLRIPSEGIFPYGTLLFPLLTGLFGMPSMIVSLGTPDIVPQTDDEKNPVGTIPGIKGVVTGLIAGWFPGITATSGAILSDAVTPEREPEDFISMTASIGTSASIIMLVTMSVTGKGRSGTMTVVNEILGDSVIGPLNVAFLLLLTAAALATLLGYMLTIGCGKAVSKIVAAIDITLLNRLCIISVTVLVLVMTGPWGLVILMVSTIVGFLPMSVGMGRVYLTGCILTPTLLTYLGVRDALLSVLCA